MQNCKLKKTNIFVAFVFSDIQTTWLNFYCYVIQNGNLHIETSGQPNQLGNL